MSRRSDENARYSRVAYSRHSIEHQQAREAHASRAPSFAQAEINAWKRGKLHESDLSRAARRILGW